MGPMTHKSHESHEYHKSNQASAREEVKVPQIADEYCPDYRPNPFVATVQCGHPGAETGLHLDVALAHAADQEHLEEHAEGDERADDAAPQAAAPRERVPQRCFDRARADRESG